MNSYLWRNLVEVKRYPSGGLYVLWRPCTILHSSFYKYFENCSLLTFVLMSCTHEDLDQYFYDIHTVWFPYISHLNASFGFTWQEKCPFPAVLLKFVHVFLPCLVEYRGHCTIDVYIWLYCLSNLYTLWRNVFIYIHIYIFWSVL